MSSTGRGQLLLSDLPTGSGRALAAMLRPQMHIPGSDTTAATILGDYWWGTGTAAPLPPVQIPICWLSMPVRLRMEQPVDQTTIDRPGGVPTYAIDRASIAEYGVYPFDATLATATAADPANLASWVLTYRSQPQMSAPSLTIDLLYRTDSEKRLVLGVAIGRRIQLTGVPAEFPEGASSLIVTGIQHTVGVTVRRVTWTTDPVPGTDPGVPGPWFYLDSSALGGSDVVPF